MSQSRSGTAERIAWWCLISVPVAVPLAVSQVPFARGDLLTYSGFLVPKLFALGVLTGTSLVAWAVAVVRGQGSIRRVPNAWWLVGFFGLAIVSTATALHVPTALFGESTQYTGLFFFLLCGALLFLGVQLVSSASRMRELSFSVVLGGALVALFGIAQVLGAEPFPTPGALSWVVYRGASTLGNPDFTGTYLILPLLLSVGIALSQAGLARRIAAWSASALLAFALLITMTRGAWVGAVVGLGVMIVVTERSGSVSRRTLLALIGVAAAIVVAVVALNPGMVAERLADLTGGWASAGGGRLLIWREALAVIGRHPILGVGPGSYRLGWYPIASLERLAVATRSVAVDPHNVLLMLAATVGIPAMVVGVCFVVSVVSTGMKGATSHASTSTRVIYAAWWSAIIGLATAFVFALNAIVTMSCLWLAMGVVLAAQSRSASISRRGSLVVASVVMLFALAAIVVSSVYLLSDYTLARAQSRAPLRLAQRAVAQAPWNADARTQSAYESAAAAVLALQAHEPDAASLLEAADDETLRLIAFNPHEWYSYYLRAKLMTDAGAVAGPDVLAKAVVAADDGLAVYPASMQLRIQRALALMELGRYEQVATALADVWNADPRDYQPGVIYAEALVRLGRNAEVTGVLDELGKRFEADPEAVEEIAQLRQTAE